MLQRYTCELVYDLSNRLCVELPNYVSAHDVSDLWVYQRQGEVKVDFQVSRNNRLKITTSQTCFQVDEISQVYIGNSKNQTQTLHVTSIGRDMLAKKGI